MQHLDKQAQQDNLELIIIALMGMLHDATCKGWDFNPTFASLDLILFYDLKLPSRNKQKSLRAICSKGRFEMATAVKVHLSIMGQNYDNQVAEIKCYLFTSEHLLYIKDWPTKEEHTHTHTPGGRGRVG